MYTQLHEVAILQLSTGIKKIDIGNNNKENAAGCLLLGGEWPIYRLFCQFWSGIDPYAYNSSYNFL
jgi:hypothetical protein